MFGLPRRASQSRGYSGSDTHRHIDRLINDSSSVLKVVSPFITPDYAGMLQRVSKRKRVYVLTSGAQSAKQNQAISIMRGKRRIMSYKIVLGLLLVLLGTIALKLFLYSVISAVVLALSVVLWLRRPKSNLKLKVVTNRFIHEKLYLSDRSAIVGSANLTYAGTHRNIEHIEMIDDRARIDELSEHFDEMWSSY